MDKEKSQNILLETLVSQGRLSQNKINELAKKYQNAPFSDRKRWDEILQKEKILDPTELAKIYAQIFNLPFIYLAGKVVSFEAAEVLSEDLCRRYFIFPYEKNKNVIKIAIANPSSLKFSLNQILKNIEREKGIKLELAVTPFSDWQKAVSIYERLKNSKKAEPDNDKRMEKESSLPETLELFPYDVAKRYKMVVYEQPSAEIIKVGAVDPENQSVQHILNFIKEKNRLQIEVKRITDGEFEDFLKKYKEYKKELGIENLPKAPKVEFKEKKKEDKEDKEEKEVKTPSAPSEVLEVLSGELPEKERAEMQKVTSEVERSGDAQLQERNLDKFLGKEIKTPEALKDVVKNAQIPKIVATIIKLAIQKKASDIHVETHERSVHLRYRIDGILEDVMRFPIEMHAPIVSRIKILSKLKIDEKRIPQDGRFRVETAGREVDLRISTLPTVYGEKVVMRLLDKSQGIFSLEELGITGQSYRLLVKNIEKPYGIVLVTGPTGSGKSTTLYAALNRLNTPEINIITLEDPVEYEIEGVNQCQIKPNIGFGFAEGLRSILRQDPNIIMVGEVRDNETASMTTHAALTGHLVLTTLHTNDAAGALPRLINMGVEPFLITSSINLIIAQRLVRRLCPICRIELEVPENLKKEVERELNNLNHENKKELFGEGEIKTRFYTAKGCDNCNQGYSGRIGIYEVLPMDEQIEDMAVKNEPAAVIGAKAIEEGMITMKQDGYIKVLKGITSLDEVMRVTTAEE